MNSHSVRQIGLMTAILGMTIPLVGGASIAEAGGWKIKTPKVHVNPPQVRVDPPRVRANLPQMRVNPPRVRTNPPQMRVNPPRVRANPPQIRVNPPKVSGNPFGRIISPPRISVPAMPGRPSSALQFPAQRNQVIAPWMKGATNTLKKAGSDTQGEWRRFYPGAEQTVRKAGQDTQAEGRRFYPRAESSVEKAGQDTYAELLRLLQRSSVRRGGSSDGRSGNGRGSTTCDGHSPPNDASGGEDTGASCTSSGGGDSNGDADGPDGDGQASEPVMVGGAYLK